MTINAHPELPEFDYIRPSSLKEASRFLADHAGEARPLMGGTDIFVRMRDGFWKDKYLVDVKNLDGTGELRYDPHTGLTIGAGINMNQVIASQDVQRVYPLLVQSCRSVASFQLRTRATIAGNICNASPAGDTIGACLVLDGSLKIYSAGGFRLQPLSTFFLGPGKTVLQAGDIVTAVLIPVPPASSAGTYIKLGRNKWSDLSIVGVTAYGFPDAAAASGYRFRVALASVAPVPLMVTAVEEYLAANPVTPAALKEAGRLAESACNPIDDVRGSARYRKAMVRNLTTRALETVYKEIENRK